MTDQTNTPTTKQEEGGEDAGLVLPVITPNADLAKWLGDVAGGQWSWGRNTRCKYVTLRIDTRRGAYAICDRDDKPLSFGELRWQYSSETPSPKGLDTVDTPANPPHNEEGNSCKKCTSSTAQAATPLSNESNELSPTSGQTPAPLSGNEEGLRKALEPFVRHGRAVGAFNGDPGPFWIMTDTGHRDVPVADFLAARQALGEVG